MILSTRVASHGSNCPESILQFPQRSLTWFDPLTAGVLESRKFYEFSRHGARCRFLRDGMDSRSTAIAADLFASRIRKLHSAPICAPTLADHRGAMFRKSSTSRNTHSGSGIGGRLSRFQSFCELADSRRSPPPTRSASEEAPRVENLRCYRIVTPPTQSAARKHLAEDHRRCLSIIDAEDDRCAERYSRQSPRWRVGV